MKHRTVRAAACLAASLLIAGCGSATPSGPGTSPGQSGLPTAGASASSTGGPTGSAVAGTVEGPGDLVLDPVAGIDALGGHRATLTESLDGAWSVTTTLIANGDDRAQTVERTGEVPDDYPEAGWSALVGGAIYHVDGDQCSAALATEAPPAEGSAAEVNGFAEPAAWLLGLIGASLEKSESIGGVDVKTYTFDGLALGIPDAAVATGSVSVATTDGHVVRYSLAVTGGEDELGEGLTGTLTTTYELTDAGSPPAIELPDGCPPGKLDFLVPNEATDVTVGPGHTSFTLAGKVSNAVGIVRGGSVIAHWQAGEVAIFDDEAWLAFTADGLAIEAFFVAVEGGTAVDIVATRS